MQQIIEQRVLPFDNHAENHYYTARDTDSAFVHTRIPQSVENPQQPHGDFIEKFLFYRGVGRFDQPLQVTVDDDGSITVVNQGLQPISSLFRLKVVDNTLSVTEFNQLPPGQNWHPSNDEKNLSMEELRSVMTLALEREGLYHREAMAMVNTWANSWFAEEGTRIFYLVPQQLTDKLIPLTITPKPDETVRVLVGRVEVMTPSVEKKLLDIVSRRAMHRALLVKRHVEENNPDRVILPIPKPLIELGRLAEPAMVRIRELAHDATVAQEATNLIQEMQSQSNPNEVFVEVQD